MRGDALVPTGDTTALAQRTAKTAEGAFSINTKRAYEGDLKRFAAWCTGGGRRAMPASPRTIGMYVQHLADTGHRISTIERALAAICTSHTRSGHPSPWRHPDVADVMKGLRRQLGTRPKKKKAADDEILRRMLAVLPSGLLGLRDRVVLTLAWCGALRRSELVALDVADITRAPKGLVVTILGSKTDQERKGEEVPIFFSNSAECCPVRSLDAWLAAAAITEGPIVRQLGRRQELGERLSAGAIYDRVRHWAKVAGLRMEDFGAHSLRSGFMTTAARRGKDLDSIMKTSRHKSERVARGYIERETLHERGAGEGLL